MHKSYIYTYFLNKILETGDFQYFVLSIDKGYIKEITYPFILELMLKNKKKHNKCFIYAINNFENIINMHNNNIIEIFIRISDNIKNYEIKRFLLNYNK
jgi:hypothetical protein